MFLPVLCEATIIKNMLFISAQARKKFPSVPAHEISFSIDFRAQSPKIEVLHLDEVSRLVPDLGDTIRVAATARQFVCLSTNPSSENCPIPLECEVLYNLLEVLRQPIPDPRKHKECLDVAKQYCQSFENLFNEVNSDFRLFLTDTSRRKWSNSNAKDIVCRSFEVANLNWLSNRPAAYIISLKLT